MGELRQLVGGIHCEAHLLELVGATCRVLDSLPSSAWDKRPQSLVAILSRSADWSKEVDCIGGTSGVVVGVAMCKFRG
jgi:hypothetical protein